MSKVSPNIIELKRDIKRYVDNQTLGSTSFKRGQIGEEILFTCLWALLNVYMKSSRKGAEAQRYEEEFICCSVMPVYLCLAASRYEYIWAHDFPLYK